MDLELHIFADASTTAFAAVAYWRIIYYDRVDVAFVSGKSRCAPRKLQTVPRLELEAAKLAIRLKRSILSGHRLKPSKIILWSDSEIVLAWIHLRAAEYSQFVYNRVAEILESSEASDWRWVPTECNPADDATRIDYSPSSPESRWITGPTFLRSSSETWPEQKKKIVPVADERKAVLTLRHDGDEVSELDLARFSKFSKLLGAQAWIGRALRNWPAKYKESRIQGPLTATEYQEARLALYRRAQMEGYPEELQTLKSGDPIDRRSAIANCDPILGEDGLMRVGIILRFASIIPYDNACPIILPPCNKVTDLLIQQHHVRFHHMFQEAVMASIRREHWIPRLRSRVKTIKSECQFCKVKNAVPRQPCMGPLPIDRVIPVDRPFLYTGVDLFGPISVTTGRRAEKVWAALFICLQTTAIHVEVVDGLSTDAFLLAFRNFINIRGVPKRVRSDNGTNFIGVAKELNNVPDFLDHAQLLEQTSGLGVEWIFNTPKDPSGGGIWERAIQTMKRTLRDVLDGRSLKRETLRLFLYEAMNICNQRPLTHVPVDPEDMNPLTPNDFLLGYPNPTQTPAKYDPRATLTRKQWRYSQALKNRMWHKFWAGILPCLVKSDKWHKRAPPLQRDQVVYVCDPDLPRSRWQLGRIIQVFTGKDGQTRSALVKTSSGVIRRPANKLAVLEVAGEGTTEAVERARSHRLGRMSPMRHDEMMAANDADTENGIGNDNDDCTP